MENYLVECRLDDDVQYEHYMLCLWYMVYGIWYMNRGVVFALEVADDARLVWFKIS